MLGGVTKELDPCLWEHCQQWTDTLEVYVAQSSEKLFLPHRQSRQRERIKGENEDFIYEPMCGLTHVRIKPSEVSTSP